MGATAATIGLRGVSGAYYGLSAYFAGADAAGYIAPVTMTGVATAASPTDFVVPEPVRIVSWTAGPTTGTITIDSDGMPTPININVAGAIAAAANPNAVFGQLRGTDQKGRIRYRIRVTGAMSA
jgi:hypothetical protein